MSPSPLAFLPLGLRLADRPCVVVGGGGVGARKVQTLLLAQARVLVVAPQAREELQALAAQGRIRWAREPFRGEHLEGAFLAVAATDEGGVNEAVVREAEARGVLVCDASAAERSGVIFGALHREEDFLVAVFTDGRDPARARQVRDRMAAVLAGAAPSVAGPGRAGPQERGQAVRISSEEGPPGSLGKAERGAPLPPSAPGSKSSSLPPPPLLILVAHGSRDREWRDTLERLAGLTRERIFPQEVAVAYIQFSQPTLPAVVEQALARGVGRFRLLPLFMAAAGHVEKDVVPLVRALAAKHTDAEFVLLPPLGEDPRLAELVAAMAASAP